MTQTSFDALKKFLNKFQPEFFDEMRIADYGGTDNIGAHDVRNLLASGKLTDYRMLDFDSGVDLRKPIRGAKFDLGICMDLLEHTSNPFIVAKNIKNSLKKGALLFITVPFVWPLHGFPDDFWRFSPSGVMELFKGMERVYLFIEKDSYGPDAKTEKALKKLPDHISPPYIRIIGVFRKI